VTEAALRRIGIATIGDLARMPESALAAAIGANAAHGLAALARGEDPREVIADEEAKSVGAEETFEEDLRDRAAIERALLEQAGRVGRRLRAHGQAGDVVTLKVKYADFSLVTRRVTLPHPTDDDGEIWAAARAQLARVALDRAVRLTGVSVSGLGGGAARPQLDLFGGAAAPAGASAGAAGSEKRRALNAALDALSDRFGERAVRRADLVDGDEGEG
jgi:DNA polymerase-4